MVVGDGRERVGGELGTRESGDIWTGSGVNRWGLGRYLDSIVKNKVLDDLERRWGTTASASPFLALAMPWRPSGCYDVLASLRHLGRQIHDFIKELCMYPYHSNGLLDPPKVLSDIVESLIGAIYLDSIFNQEVVWQVFQNLADPLISLETLGKHPVSELFEFCQKTRRGVKIVKDEWDKSLTVEVLIDGELVGSATYAQKKEIAQNRAAKAALDKLKETLGQSQTESALGEVSEPLDKLDLAGTLEVQ